MFSQQKSREKWTNLRYGGGLLLALDRWELNRGLALDVVEALAESSIPGSDYLLVMDLFSRALSLRITVEEMAQRIIFAAPDCRSITAIGKIGPLIGGNNMRSRILATISLMCICIIPLSGITSSYVGVFGTLSSFETSPSIGAKGNFDFRSLVGNQVMLRLLLRQKLLSIFPILPSPIGIFGSNGVLVCGNEGELITSIGSQFTLAEESTWIPDWSLGFRTTFPSWNLAPSVAYRGYVTDTYLSTAMELSTTYTPRVSWRTTLR